MQQCTGLYYSIKHSPIMKKEELFEGAIVLARKSIYERRSRCKILEIGDRIVKIERQKDNCIFSTGITCLRPAKITLKGVRELGLEELVWCNRELKRYCMPQKACFYADAGVKVLVNSPFDTLVTNDINRTEVRYIHELQREIKNLIQLNS